MYNIHLHRVEKQDQLQSQILDVDRGPTVSQERQNTNRRRTCKSCGKPMRGHKRGEC